MLILSVKLKNALNKRASELGMKLEYKLKNISINGEKRGCSGFVKNLANGSIVYVDTEEPYLSTLHYMYRHADSFTDYTGYRNRWADTLPALVQGIFECLAKTPQEDGDRRILRREIMHIRTKEDFATEINSMGYSISYRGQFLTGAGVNKANFYYDGRKKPRGRCTTSNSSLNHQAAEADIKACLAGVPGRYLTRCNEIDAALGD